MWWSDGQGLKMPRRTIPANRKLRSFVHAMTTLDKRVLFVDEKEQTVDLQQPSQVDRLLQELSKSFRVTVKDAVTHAPSPDDPGLRYSKLKL
jgi:ABC-type transporter Mla maintaining outer membrane lipid asymmetry ATPase subunit MlaF